jgi:FtsP/CotA-like multicopper oxidase with cupredoxin domain
VANGRVFDPQLAGLDRIVIAMDGMSVPTPLRMERIDLAPGNRVDLDVTIPTGAAGSTFEIRDGFSRDRPVLARIAVTGETVETPLGETPRGRVPAWISAVDAEPTLVFRLNARLGGPYGVEWTINDEVMRHDDEPDQADGHEKCSAPYSLPVGRFAKLRFANLSARLHPMHIHGQFFKVLARDGKTVDEPQWRDTVLVRGRQTIDVGLVPVDEGLWMLHCHILEHADSGMMTLVKVAPRNDG